jgi:hypothetical protein
MVDLVVATQEQAVGPLPVDLEMAVTAVPAAVDLAAVDQEQAVGPRSADLVAVVTADLAVVDPAVVDRELVAVPRPGDLVVVDMAARQREPPVQDPPLLMARGTVQLLALTRAGLACPAWERLASV